MQYRVETRLRPVRFGLLAGLANVDSFIRAVQISNSLWGARYNPILPALAKIEGDWAEPYSIGGDTPQSLLERWYRQFDADLFLRMPDASPNVSLSPAKTMTQFFNAEPDWEHVVSAHYDPNDYGNAYGIGLLEVAQDFNIHESPFVRHTPFRIISPTIAGHEALSAAMFGSLDSYIADLYARTIGPAHEPLEINISEALDYLSPEILTPLAMSDRAIMQSGTAHIEFYVLSENNPRDLAIFWNVRAHLPHMVPLTSEMLADDAVVQRLQQTLESNGGLAQHRRILVGCENTEGLPYVLERLKLENPIVNYLFARRDPPDELSDWSSDIFAGERTEIVSEEEGLITIPTREPSFKTVDAKSGLRYANEVKVVSLTGNPMPAQVIPRDGMASLGKSTLHSSMMPWRIGPQSFVFFPYRASPGFQFQPPDARLVMQTFFASHGLKSGTSEHGMLLEQLLKQLRTRLAAGLITNSAVQEATKNLDGRGTIKDVVLFQYLKKDIGEEGTYALVDTLVQNSILAAGMIQQCSVCNQHPWFRLNDLAQGLTCEYCRGGFDASILGHKRLTPAFRILAPLDDPKNRAGLVAVLALLNFLRERVETQRFTLSPGVKLSGKGFEFEYDLVGLSRGLYRSPNTTPLFAESSAHLPFVEVDFNRMQSALRLFPRATFIFSTLRAEVTADETKALEKFAKITSDEADDPTHLTVLLTSRQLVPQGDRYFPENYTGDLIPFSVKTKCD
jgi:hypothetical protein